MATRVKKALISLTFAYGFIVLIMAPLLVKQAMAIEGLPGSTWEMISHDVDSLVGTGAMGYVNQGVDWVKLPGGITFNTFAEFRYRVRSENRPYFNAYGEALGIEFKKSIFHLGVNYLWENYPELSDHSNKFQYYLSGYYNWDLKSKNLKFLKGFPGSTWDYISYDADSFIGAGAMGWVNQGIDWMTLPGGITFNTFAEFRYWLRSENRPYYNAYGQALGFEFKKSIFRLGADFFWETYPELNVVSNKVQFYLTWFYDWDLKSKPDVKQMSH